MKEKEVVKAIHKGVYLANKNYKDWSGGWFLSECAGESFMVTHIAQQIMKLESAPSYLQVECSIKGLLSDSENLRGRPIGCTNGKQRVDLALFNNDYLLKFAIEAKCSHAWSTSYLDDVKRLAILQSKLSKKNSSTAMQAGIFVAFIHSKGKDFDTAEINLENRIIRWGERFNNYDLSKKNLRLSVNISEEKNVMYETEDKVYLGTSICVVVK